MASVLFTALALIAAGQAGPVSSASSDATVRSSPVGKASSPAPKGGPAALRALPRRRG